MKNPDEMTAEELRAQIDSNQPPDDGGAPAADPPSPTPTPPPADEGIEWAATDGTVYKAKTQEELWDKVTKALNDTKTHAHGVEQTVRELKAKLPAEPPAPPQFDDKKYFELLATKPIEAQDYLDSFREGPKKTQQFVQMTTEQQQRQAAIQRFYADVPEFAKVETPEVTDAFKARMLEAGRSPANVDHLKLTYYELKDAGKLAHQPKPKKPMPGSPGSSGRGVPGEPAPDINKMSAAELKAYIEKQQEALAAQ